MADIKRAAGDDPGGHLHANKQAQDVPVGRSPVGGGPAIGLVGAPGPGAPNESGSGGRVPGGRPGEPGPGGRPGGGGPGGVPAADAVAGRGAAAGVRGGAGNPGGMVPAGGRPAGAEDNEHQNKYGPVDRHDGFWDDTPPVAPPVIGLEPAEP